VLEPDILLAASEDPREAMRGSRASNIHREACRALSPANRRSAHRSSSTQQRATPSEINRMTEAMRRHRVDVTV